MREKKEVINDVTVYTDEGAGVSGDPRLRLDMLAVPEKRYEFTGETKTVDGVTLRRIRACRDFSMRKGGESEDTVIKAGQLGGFIESEWNLPQYESGWVADEAMVYGNAVVSGSAYVGEFASVYGHAKVCGNAVIYEEAQVYDDAEVYGNANVSGGSKIYGDAKVCDDAQIGHWGSDVQIFDHAEIYGHSTISDYAKIYGHAKVYGWYIYGRDEFYGDAEINGYETHSVSVNKVGGNAYICFYTDYTIVAPMNKYDEDFSECIEVYKTKYGTIEVTDHIVTCGVEEYLDGLSKRTSEKQAEYVTDAVRFAAKHVECTDKAMYF